MPLDRTTNYQNSGDFLAGDVNGDFDKIYIGAIQNENEGGRSLRLQDVEPPTAGVDMTLPLKADRKGKYLSFNSVTGAPEVVAGTGGSVTDASLVNYTPAGTGAVVTTVQAKLRETISVKDFGAVGDGDSLLGTGTDNAAFIQAALDSIDEDLGGRIHFPAGVYAIKSGLSVKPRTVITGDGWEASTVMIHNDAPPFTSNADAMFYLNGGDMVGSELPSRYIHFRNLSLNGNDNNTVNNTFNGIVAKQSLYCSVVECEIKQFDRDGLVFLHASGDSSNAGWLIQNNLIRDCNSDGIVLQRARNFEISNNIIRTQSGNGIEFEGEASERIHITGNQFNQNQTNAILCAVLSNYGVDGVDSPGSNGTNAILIQDNIFYGCCKPNDDAGGEYFGVIHATGVEDWMISGNKFTENDAYDIYIDTNNGKISNNYFYKSYRHGLYLTSGRNVQVSDNYFINASVRLTNTYDAMYINSPVASITGNRVVYDSSVSTPQQKYGLNITSGGSNCYVFGNHVISSGATANYTTASGSTRMVQNFGIGQTGTFDVNLSANQTSIAVGSDVTVLFNNAVINVGDDFNTSTYRFTASFAGMYSLDAGIRLTSLDIVSNYYSAKISIYNSSDVLQRNYQNIIDPNFTADLTLFTSTLSCLTKLEAGWYAVVYVRQDSGTVQTSIDADSWFSGSFVADYT
jgi:hypothetical protein